MGNIEFRVFHAGDCQRSLREIDAGVVVPGLYQGGELLERLPVRG
jgi:hypothetical protein